ncbi:hypothetical protein BDU57DRAFT_509520 [Ampelomyces quisqualis]|uniref:Uncharacterized protein n=1 Tax=Ampelomyces quisqualis TaxID=50730 RepID=A0A6A5R0L0_AMPQU|nr:hypothetical protein BDU57DRAFT_509520 [Ampelomyces quisqualis]
MHFKSVFLAAALLVGATVASSIDDLLAPKCHRGSYRPPWSQALRSCWHHAGAQPHHDHPLHRRSRRGGVQPAQHAGPVRKRV